MQIFALFMFLGCLTSFLVPESKNTRLEDLAGEADDVYELQFRSRFYAGQNGNPGSLPGNPRNPTSAFLGLGGRERGGIGRGGFRRGGRERSHTRGSSMEDMVEKGKWWKIV